MSRNIFTTCHLGAAQMASGESMAERDDRVEYQSEGLDDLIRYAACSEVMCECSEIRWICVHGPTNEEANPTSRPG